LATDDSPMTRAIRFDPMNPAPPVTRRCMGNRFRVEGFGLRAAGIGRGKWGRGWHCLMPDAGRPTPSLSNPIP